MDNAKKDTLNPQLKEIYERVMSTKVPTSSAPPPPPSTSPQPANQPQPASQRPATFTSVAINPAPAQSTTNTPSTNAGGTKSFSSILLGIAALIFFLAYGLFWIRYFNVALPFSLPF